MVHQEIQPEIDVITASEQSIEKMQYCDMNYLYIIIYGPLVD